MSSPVSHPVSDNLYLVASRELGAKCHFLKFGQSTLRYLNKIHGNDVFCSFVTIIALLLPGDMADTIRLVCNILILRLIHNSHFSECLLLI